MNVVRVSRHVAGLKRGAPRCARASASSSHTRGTWRGAPSQPAGEEGMNNSSRRGDGSSARRFQHPTHGPALQGLRLRRRLRCALSCIAVLALGREPRFPAAAGRLRAPRGVRGVESTPRGAGTGSAWHGMAASEAPSAAIHAPEGRPSGAWIAGPARPRSPEAAGAARLGGWGERRGDGVWGTEAAQRAPAHLRGPVFVVAVARRHGVRLTLLSAFETRTVLFSKKKTQHVQ